jgi:hypothetical protein
MINVALEHRFDGAISTRLQVLRGWQLTLVLVKILNAIRCVLDIIAVVILGHLQLQVVALIGMFVLEAPLCLLVRRLEFAEQAILDMLVLLRLE